MLNKLVYVFAVCILVGSIALAGTGVKKAFKAVADAEKAPTSVVFNTETPAMSKVGAITWAGVDTAGNVFGMANTDVNPIAYDPYSKVVAFVHRSAASYGGGTGNIFYNYSTNQGTTWQKRVGPMAAGLGANTGGRYPSMTLSNAAHYTKPESVLVEVQIAYLIGGAAFGGLIYSVDPGVGAGSAIAAIDTGKQTWTSQFTSWASTSSNDVWITAYASEAGKAVTIMHTSDGVTFTKTNPKQFADSVFNGNVANYMGAYRNGATYFGMTATYKGAAATDTGTYTFAVSKSTNMGTNWSNFDIVSWHQFAGFASGKMMITDHAYNVEGANTSTNRFTVDANGGVHWATVFVDTTVTPNKWSVYDVYKASGANGSGAWVPVKVRDLPTHRNWAYGALNQSGVEIEAAASENGKYITFKWIEDAQGAAFADSLPIPDVYASVWNTTNGTWTTPQNLTSTPAVTDQITHIAPLMDNDGTIYLVRNEEPGVTVKPLDTNPAVTYFGKFTLTLTGVQDRFEPVVGSYALTQNYPNPFNPSTQINFTLPVNGQTTLKVYNMIGQEVTTLLSGFKQAGTYFVTFDASQLSSGVYFYKLESGSFSLTKKMVLMK